MNRKIVMGCALGALLAPAVPAAAADGVVFAYHFEKGASQRYRVSVNMEADMHGATMSQLVDMEVTVKCVSTSDTLCAMEMSFDKVEMSRAMFGDMAADPRGEQLVGHAVAFNVDKVGRVGGIKSAGYFEGWDEVRSVIEPVVKDWYVYLPGETVALGGEWKQDETEKQSTGVEVTTNSRFKFKEVRKEKGRDCAVVEATIDNVLGGEASGPAGAMAVSGKGKGKFEFLFDPAAGVVVKYKGKYDVDMDMVPTSGAGDAMQTTIGYQIEKELL